MNKNNYYEVIGWYGFIGLLLAYAIVSFGFVNGNNVYYQLFNFTGAVGIAWISLKKKTYQPAVLNIIWAIIALITLIKIII
jgi:hypothetical protein